MTLWLNQITNKRLPSINEKMEADLDRRIEDLKKFNPTNTLQKRIDDEKQNTNALAKRQIS